MCAKLTYNAAHLILKTGAMMPTAAAIIWIAISGLIVVMLGIIGYLIKTGFENVRDQIQKEFKVIWEKIDLQQSLADDNRIAIATMKATCDERHKPYMSKGE